jgi:CRISPR-associated protein Cmr6
MIPSLPAGPNAGLVFDRFLKIWQGSFDLVKERLGPLQQFVKEYAELERHVSPLLNARHEHLRALAGGTERGERTAVAQERLVSGLGSSHPLENGFCFDYALGVPHLPGSSVKGLCRQMAELDGDERAIRTLFGNGDEDDRRAERNATAGDIVFLPAYPKGWPALEIDVINCHQPAYYGSNPVVLRADTDKPNGGGGASSQRGERRKRVGPLEVEDPVPVFFLTVARGTRFVFRCFSRSGTPTNVAQALELLSDGLATLGIGAKTALGYGVMAQE